MELNLKALSDQINHTVRERKKHFHFSKFLKAKTCVNSVLGRNKAGKGIGPINDPVSQSKIDNDGQKETLLNHCTQ
jgi:YbbR domain-containing protein